jgi:anti-anti-sigma regulatory factor
MTTTKAWLTLDEKTLTPVLREAARDLVAGERELGLNFTSVRRMDSAALQALQQLADLAGERGVKVFVRGVTPYVYRVLKLVKLASRFSFANGATGLENGHA